MTIPLYMYGTGTYLHNALFGKPQARKHQVLVPVANLICSFGFFARADHLFNRFRKLFRVRNGIVTWYESCVRLISPRRQWIVRSYCRRRGLRPRPSSSGNIDQGRMERSRRSLLMEGPSTVWVVAEARWSLCKAGGMGTGDNYSRV